MGRSWCPQAVLPWLAMLCLGHSLQGPSCWVGISKWVGKQGWDLSQNGVRPSSTHPPTKVTLALLLQHHSDVSSNNALRFTYLHPPSIFFTIGVVGRSWCPQAVLPWLAMLCLGHSLQGPSYLTSCANLPHLHRVL